MSLVKSSILSKTAWISCLLLTWIIMISLSSAQFVTWTKIPKDPTFGAAGENITLQWKYVMNLEADDSFDFFIIRRFQPSKGDYDDIVKYGRDGKEIVYNRYKGRFALAKNATPELLLIKAEESDEEKYCCNVYSRKNNVQKCVTLKILVRPNITSISTDQTSNETDDVVLSCNATGKPFPNITWSKQGKKEWKHTGSLLLLKNISRYQDGEYRCTATNYAGNATASIRVTVNYPPSIFPGTKSFNITEGDDIELECRSDGHPPPVVTWKRIGGLTADITLKPGQRLTIKNASRFMAGDYVCTASNGIRDLQASTLINVNVFFPPSIVSEVLNKTLNATEDMRLPCNATGNPQPTVTWSKRPSVITLSSPDGVLTVTNVSKADSGVYQCKASNGIGNDAIVTSTIVVNYKPEIKNKFSSDVVSWIDHKTVITCTAEGFPVPGITWSHNGVVQSSALKTSAESRTRHSTLTFTPQGAKDFGVYVCIARNCLGTDKKEITVGELGKNKQSLIPRHMIKWIIVGVAGLVIVMVVIVLAAYKGLSRRRGQFQVKRRRGEEYIDTYTSSV